MQSSFANNWRQQQNLASTPLQDSIYREHLKAKLIHRPQDESDPNFELDLCLGIDASVTVLGGMRLLIQEKSLSNEFASYNTISVEKWQDSGTKEQGDWFTCAADVYFIGYLNAAGDDYDRWCLLNWASVKLAHRYVNNRPIWRERENERDGCRASFAAIEANALYRVCPECFIGQSGMLSPSNAGELAARNRRREFGGESVTRCCS